MTILFLLFQTSGHTLSGLSAWWLHMVTLIFLRGLCGYEWVRKDKAGSFIKGTCCEFGVLASWHDNTGSYLQNGKGCLLWEVIWIQNNRPMQDSTVLIKMYKNIHVCLLQVRLRREALCTPYFHPPWVRTHDLQTMTVHFMSLRPPAQTARPSVTSNPFEKLSCIVWQKWSKQNTPQTPQKS